MSAWWLKFDKYLEISKIAYQDTLTYLVSLLSRAGTIIFRIWIFTQLYTVTYEYTGQSQVGGMSVAMVIWVLMLTQSFASSTRPLVSKLIEEEVKSGTLAYSVNKPYSYILFHLFGYLGRCWANLVANLVIGVLAAVVLVGVVKISLVGILLGIILLIFGLVLNFLFSMIIGLSAFWLEDISSLHWIYQKGQMVFGGQILPLALFPIYWQKIIYLLPFGQMFYNASATMINFSWAAFEQSLIVQLIWLLVVGVGAELMFRLGVKNVSINGG
ncbi:MAG: ABC-2 family transporter protein [Patescibacteria group bacterium]